MKLIESKVELLQQPAGLEGVYKQIEAAGRTCYKSEDKITPDSAKEFVDRMIKNGHTAMLEHGTVYLKVPLGKWLEDSFAWDTYLPQESPWVSMFCEGDFVYVTTNYRFIIENLRDWMIRDYWCEPTKFHPKRVSIRFTCDRGVSHELVRHKRLCAA